MTHLRIFLLVTAFAVASPLFILAQSEQNETQTSDTTLTVDLKVKGITCSTDLKMISDNVLKLDGVISCVPGKSGPTTSFKITFNPMLVELTEIDQAIEGTGGCERPEERPYKVKKRKQDS